MRPERLELPAYWFEASRSIQLSYGRAVCPSLSKNRDIRSAAKNTRKRLRSEIWFNDMWEPGEMAVYLESAITITASRAESFHPDGP